MSSLGPGISARQAQRLLGIASFGSTWTLLHRLRAAMVDPDRSLLSGEVEVGETWVGGRQAGLRGGRQTTDRKAVMVVVAVERRASGFGRLHLEPIPDPAMPAPPFSVEIHEHDAERDFIRAVARLVGTGET